jgi:hypothetical protein
VEFNSRTAAVLMDSLVGGPAAGGAGAAPLAAAAVGERDLQVDWLEAPTDSHYQSECDDLPADSASSPPLAGADGAGLGLDLIGGAVMEVAANALLEDGASCLRCAQLSDLQRPLSFENMMPSENSGGGSASGVSVSESQHPAAAALDVWRRPEGRGSRQNFDPASCARICRSEPRVTVACAMSRTATVF